MLHAGIDFGTTNTVIALLGADGTTRSAIFGTEQVFRSVLCFWSEEGRSGRSLHHAAGPEAITAYLDDPLDSRLIMSMKTYLAQRSFVDTRIFGRRFSLPDLIAHFLRALATAAGLDPAELHVVAGSWAVSGISRACGRAGSSPPLRTCACSGSSAPRYVPPPRGGWALAPNMRMCTRRWSSG